MRNHYWPKDKIHEMKSGSCQHQMLKSTCFLKYISNRSRRNEGILLKSVTTQTQIWNWTFLLVLTHCGAAELGREKVSVTKPWPNYHIKKVHKALKSIEKGNSTSYQIHFKNYKFQFSFLLHIKWFVIRYSSNSSSELWVWVHIEIDLDRRNIKL